VAPRIGIAVGTDPKKLEKQMMELLPPEQWGEAGMAISFLGREICRPSNPKCPECVMKKVCSHYRENPVSVISKSKDKKIRSRSVRKTS
jgi:endonuclease-3